MSDDEFGQVGDRDLRRADGWMVDPAEREQRERLYEVTRRRRRAFLGGFVAVIAGVAGVIGALSLFGGGEVPEASAVTTSGPGTSVAAPDAISWFAVEATVSGADRIVMTGDGTFYALSTAPGQQAQWPPIKALYSSVDGETWTTEIVGDSISPQDMAARNGTVYLIGTAPGNEELVVAIDTTTDGGLTWDSTVLPVTAASPGPESFMNNSIKIAATDAGVLAVVQTRYWIDYWQLVPQDLLRGPVDVVETATGVRVIDYSAHEDLSRECDGLAAGSDFDPEQLDEPCRSFFLGETEPIVLAELTWEELGLDEGITPQFSEMFLSVDGTTFEAIESPFSNGEGLAGLYGTDSGFIAIEWPHATGRASAALWSSTDGRTWAELEGVPAMEYVNSVGSVRGRTVIVGQRAGSPVVAWEGDDGSFASVDLESALTDLGGRSTWMSAAGVGPIGVVLVVQSEGEVSSTDMLVGVAPDRWETTPLDTMLPAGWTWSAWAVVGTDRILAHMSVDTGFGSESFEIVGVVG